MHKLLHCARIFICSYSVHALLVSLLLHWFVIQFNFQVCVLVSVVNIAKLTNPQFQVKDLIRR